MASVYVKGMEMPRDKWGYTEIQIWGDGTVTKKVGKMLTWGYSAIEVPDHGDLIDRDELMKHKGSVYDIDGHELYAVGTGTILRMPVVIPAERSYECD